MIYFKLILFLQRFLRRGKAGGYRDDLNGDQIQKLDHWIDKALEGTDFKFKM